MNYLLYFSICGLYSYMISFSFFTDNVHVPVLLLIDTGKFDLHGADNPGIVHKVTSILAKHRLNIDELRTFEDSSQPNGGTSLFHMSGVATSPAPVANGFDPKVIRDELEELGNQMNCDITFEDVLDDKYSSSFYGG